MAGAPVEVVGVSSDVVMLEVGGRVEELSLSESTRRSALFAISELWGPSLVEEGLSDRVELVPLVPLVPVVSAVPVLPVVVLVSGARRSAVSVVLFSVLLAVVSPNVLDVVSAEGPVEVSAVRSTPLPVPIVLSPSVLSVPVVVVLGSAGAPD